MSHTNIIRLASLLSLASALHASTLVALFWAEATTSPTNVYSYESPLATQNGASVVAPIPTDANQNSPELDVVNYFRTVADLPGAQAMYNGLLLGNLSAYTGLTATFNISNSTIAVGDLFSSPELVGDTYSGQTQSNAGLRLYFMGGYYNDPVYGNTPNAWWSNPAVVYVTSMRNGQDVTLTALFDPSLWSNYYGHRGTESSDTLTQFHDALSGVTRAGLSFGSGYFFSNGFAFNTGGVAQIQINDFSPLDAPEPGVFVSVALGLLALYSARRASTGLTAAARRAGK